MPIRENENLNIVLLCHIINIFLSVLKGQVISKIGRNCIQLLRISIFRKFKENHGKEFVYSSHICAFNQSNHDCLTTSADF